jgi:hypothetical protein
VRCASEATDSRSGWRPTRQVREEGQMTDDIQDEVLIGVLESRGYRVEKEEEPRLAEKVDDLAGRLNEIREHPASPEAEQEQAQPPRDPERAFALGLRDALNRARSPWYSTSELGGDDGEAA